MRIEYERSGGIAGMVLRASVDGDDLPGHRELLEQLLASGAPAPPPGASGSHPPGADRFVYRLRLSEGSRSRVLRWGEADVPTAVQPLLADLNQRAHP